MRKPLNISFLTLLGWVLLAGTAAHAQAVADAERARAAAVEADAPRLAPGEFADGEKRLEKARKQAANNSSARAQKTALRAVEEYRAAELIAIQATVLEEARIAIREAERVRAEKFAEETLERAIDLEEAAANALAENRYGNTTAERLAAESATTARNARIIALVAAEKPETEQLILDRLIDLQRLEKAAGLEPDFSAEPQAVANRLEKRVAKLNADVDRLEKDLADTRAYAASVEEELRMLDERLGGARAERQELMIELESQAREREQFEQAEALFAEDEALVFRQSDKIVVRVVGLRFASGSSELQPESEGLLRKIERVISIFPGATLVVEGHTDSRGGERLNQQLSQNRAQAVLNRLVTRLGLPPNRISAIGYGETRPIANNETEEGRAQNRRIDLVISPGR